MKYYKWKHPNKTDNAFDGFINRLDVKERASELKRYVSRNFQNWNENRKQKWERWDSEIITTGVMYVQWEYQEKKKKEQRGMEKSN